MIKKNLYEEISNSLITLIGGKENISFFTHCVTRLRFNLKDKSLTKIDEIERLNGVLGCQWSGGQLQIIIGQNVGDVYALLMQKLDLLPPDMMEQNFIDDQRRFSLNKIFDAISGCITPLIPLLIGAGFIKIISLLTEMAGLLSIESPTYLVLNFIGDAGFYFLPVFVGATAAKKFGANTGLGMLIGAVFLHPAFISAVNEEVSLSIFGLPIYATTYASTIFPVLLSVWIMAPIEKFFAKKSPETIRSIVEPLGTLLIILPLALCVLGPIGAFLGTYTSNAIIWLYETTGFLGVAVLSCIMPWLIMTGMHSALAPYVFNSFATIGYEPIVYTATVISNLNQGAACAAVALKTKCKTLKSIAASCAVTAIIGGVTEPAMYGVNMKFKTPMYCSMIGSFIGAAIAGMGRAYAYTVTSSLGIFAFPIYIQENLSNLFWMIGGVLAGIVTTFIITYLSYKEKKENLNEFS